MKKCIHISILDFNLDEGTRYHHIYRLRDQDGALFSKLLEVHIIELKKKLGSAEQVDNWIRLFNARNEEDLNMIKTENAGILEAIKEMKQMSPGKVLRALYDAHMKEIRDRNARDDYVRDEGIAIGQVQGEKQKLVSIVKKKMEKDMTPVQIADLLEEDPILVAKIYDFIRKHPDWEDNRICHLL